MSRVDAIDKEILTARMEFDEKTRNHCATIIIDRQRSKSLSTAKASAASLSPGPIEEDAALDSTTGAAMAAASATAAPPSFALSSDDVLEESVELEDAPLTTA